MCYTLEMRNIYEKSIQNTCADSDGTFDSG